MCECEEKDNLDKRRGSKKRVGVNFKIRDVTGYSKKKNYIRKVSNDEILEY